MSNRSRSSLFLLEQLIAVVIFAICAAVCVKIFASSFIMANGSKDLRSAIRAAENGAECYKASAGNVYMAASLLGGTSGESDTDYFTVVHYDMEWRTCDESAAAYRLSLICKKHAGQTAPLLGELAVERISGEELITFTVAARGNAE